MRPRKKIGPFPAAALAKFLLVLKDLMWHESLETSLRFYVSLDAADTAAELWQNFGLVTGNDETFHETLPNLDSPIERGGETALPLHPTNKVSN